MKKQIFLLRHAKAAPAIDQIKDFDRTLIPFGIPEAIRKIRDGKYPTPDWTYTSPAIRCYHTASIFMRIQKIPFFQLSISRSLYDGQAEGLLETIHSASEAFNSILLVGHNPTISDFFSTVTGEQFTFDYCSFRQIEFDVNTWLDIQAFSEAKIIK